MLNLLLYFHASNIIFLFGKNTLREKLFAKELCAEEIFAEFILADLAQIRKNLFRK